MADGFSFENVYIAISQPQPNFKEIWSADANFDSEMGWVTKFFSQIHDGRRAILRIDLRLYYLCQHHIVQLTRNFEEKTKQNCI